MKLEIGSSDVPSLSFCLTSTQWRRIQWRVSIDSNFKCSICGKIDELDCHETWKIDYNEHTMTLQNAAAICKLCHLVKHGVLLRPYYYDSNGVKRNTNELDKHFMAVNNASEDVLKTEKERALKAKPTSADSYIYNHNKWIINDDIVESLITNGASGKEFCEAVEKYIGFQPKQFTHSMRCCKCGTNKGVIRVYYLKRLLKAVRDGISEEDMNRNYICLRCRPAERLKQAHDFGNNI